MRLSHHLYCVRKDVWLEEKNTQRRAQFGSGKDEFKVPKDKF